MLFAPSAVTALGLLLGLVGVLTWPTSTAPAALIGSLLCDGADGALARRLHAATPAGAEFDLSVDCLLAYLITWTVLDGPMRIFATVALLSLQVFARLVSLRFSGRFAMTVAVLALWVSR